MTTDTDIILKARLILYHEGQIRLLKQTKPKGGNYSLVGGTVESFETARQSIVREALEEAGITLKESDLRLVHVLHKRKKKGHRITLYFKAIQWEGILRNRERHKFKEAVWFPLDKLPENLTETVRQVLESYRSGVAYSEMFV